MNSKSRPNMQQSQAMDIRPVRRKPAAATKTKAAASADVKRPKNLPAAKAPKKSGRLKNLIKRLQAHPLRQHPYIIPVTVFVVMSFLAMATLVVSGGKTVGASDTRIITLAHEGKEQVIPTRARNVKAFLEELNIQVNEKDIVEPSLDTELFIGERQKIIVHKARSVKVIDGKNVITIVSAEPSAREVAEKAGLAIYPEDKIETATDVIEVADILKEGIVAETIVIDRATPIKLNLFGTTYGVRTHAETVGELAKEKGFENASVFPDTHTSLKADQSVFITDSSKKISVIEEEIPPAEETVDDYNLAQGNTEIREQGKVGRKAVIYEIGADGSKKPLQEVIIEQPVKKVIARGTRINITNPSENVLIGEEMAAARGWAGGQWYCLYQLWQRESGWNTTAGNIQSGAYGIPQSLPGSKMSRFGDDWRTNPRTQIAWGFDYISSRYGTPCGAWDAFNSRYPHWY